MSSMPVTERMTADEFLARPEDSTCRRELIDGRLVEMDMPRPRHQIVSGELHFALESWRRADPAARGLVLLPVDIRIDDGTVVGPDLCWFAAPTRVDVNRIGQPIPDLAVEVRSPSTWTYDIGTKQRIYDEAGVPELWLVDIASVHVRRRSAPGVRFDVELEVTCGEDLTSPRLPGFRLSVAGLFS